MLNLDGLRRRAASLRDGWWNDPEAAVLPLTLAGLDAAVRSFGGCPIYGWEFIDPPQDSLPVAIRKAEDRCRPAHVGAARRAHYPRQLR
ncbi:MAG TPA: hypothetical protein VFT95_03695 [Micromonosporaceae bacterium]|nr:hypothetical protein [Micromonosporaceae bacterium]